MTKFIIFTILLLIGTIGILQISYAQTDVSTSEQIILSDDLMNNPVAQDILRKIEQTKKWIADLEQRNYENLEKQTELVAKRDQSLARLNQDLVDWEKLWEYYSPYNSFERFTDNIPDSQVQDVFWDQFEFKEQKVKAGRDAFKQTLKDGGSRRDALQAYLIAAETKRIELIEANSQFNVNHNLAFYSQQILFDKTGQFIDSPITGEQLRQQYEDYRTNPTYLQANPYDAASWDDLGKTNANTECREGDVVVYRYHASDYVCVSVTTAEMWIRHGMGEIIGDSNNNLDTEKTTPLTKCNVGFSVIFNVDTKKYSCVLDSTAIKWVDQGLAEIHRVEDYIVTSIEDKETLVKIGEITLQIQDMKKEFEEKQIELKKFYDKIYDEIFTQSKLDEKKVTLDYTQSSGMTKEELSIKIAEIRKDYESEKDSILEDKINDLKELENKFEESMGELVSLYQQDPYIEVKLNSGHIAYEVVARK